MNRLELAKEWRWKVPNGRQIAWILLKNHAKEVLERERTRSGEPAA